MAVTIMQMAYLLLRPLLGFLRLFLSRLGVHGVQNGHALVRGGRSGGRVLLLFAAPEEDGGHQRAQVGEGLVEGARVVVLPQRHLRAPLRGGRAAC
eukprot:2253128-Pyramimonas_sp.AAC.1